MQRIPKFARETHQLNFKGTPFGFIGDFSVETLKVRWEGSDIFQDPRGNKHQPRIFCIEKLSSTSKHLIPVLDTLLLTQFPSNSDPGRQCWWHKWLGPRHPNEWPGPHKFRGPGSTSVVMDIQQYEGVKNSWDFYLSVSLFSKKTSLEVEKNCKKFGKR